MHIETKGAAVELRDAIIDKVDQLWCETCPLDGVGQRQDGSVSVRIRLGVPEALLHRNLHSAIRVPTGSAGFMGAVPRWSRQENKEAAIRGGTEGEESPKHGHDSDRQCLCHSSI